MRGLSFSLLEVGVAEVLAVVDLLQSKAVPGVFGVFADAPKLEKAPVPKPKADVAPVDGDATAVLVAIGDMALNGFDRPPCELSPPLKRAFVAEKTRDDEESVRASL